MRHRTARIAGGARPDKALQMPIHGPFQPADGRVWRPNTGASNESRRRCDSQRRADPSGAT